MIFQNWIYTLTEDYGCGKITNTYPNFKKAYEEIEKSNKGNIIIDCGDNFRTSIFEAIRF